MQTQEAVVRGCGTRKSGDVYSTCTLSPFGLPLEYFITDPPVSIDVEALGLSAIGTHILPDSHGVHHIWDIVGQEYYPNVCDFIEEMRRFGMSRKVAKNARFELLTRESRHILVHGRGLWTSPGVEYETRVGNYAVPWVEPRVDDPDWRCLKQRLVDDESVPVAVQHKAYTTAMEHYGVDEAWTKDITTDEVDIILTGQVPFCASLWYQDVVDGVKEGREDPATERRTRDTRRVRREMPSFSYIAHRKPQGATRAYRYAIIAAMPITKFDVIHDPGGDAEGLVAQIAGRTEIPVSLEVE